MNILYGVCGTGMGHAMRSAVVAEHLMRQGHSITFASSGPALKYLRDRAPALYILEPVAVISGNRIAAEAMLAYNLVRSLLIGPAHLLSYFGMGACVRPDVVLTDFEPCTANFAALANLPLIAVDNVHFFNRCTHPRSVIERDRAAAALMYPVAEHMVPNADRYLVTTFVPAATCKPNTSLHLPILRNIVLGAKGLATRQHVVVYFTGHSDQSAAAKILEHLPIEFRVYGRAGQTTEERSRNVTYCPFSDAAFVRDLASCVCVVGTAGFTLMTEAIYLGKPMLALPLIGQFEQILNANYLTELGYGARCDELTIEALQGFMQRVPEYRQNLRRFVHDGNRELLATVDQTLAWACA